MTEPVLKEINAYVRQSAIAIHLSASEGFEKKFRPEHSKTLTSVNKFGWLMLSQGKYEEAWRIHRRALKAKKKVPQAERLRVLYEDTKHDRGLRDEGEYKEVDTVFRRTLQESEKKSAPDMIPGLNAVAVELLSQGKLREAEAMYRRAMQVSEKLPTRYLPVMLRTIDSLTRVLSHQGKHKEAEMICRQALQKLEKDLGPKHPGTLKVIGTLRQVLTQQDKRKEAEASLYRAKQQRHRQEPLGHKAKSGPQQEKPPLQLGTQTNGRPAKKDTSDWFSAAKKYVSSSEGKKQLAAFGIGALATGIGVQTYNGWAAGRPGQQLQATIAHNQSPTLINQPPQTKFIHMGSHKKTELVPGAPPKPSESLTFPFHAPETFPFHDPATFPFHGLPTGKANEPNEEQNGQARKLKNRKPKAKRR